MATTRATERRRLPRTVVAFGVVSFLTDVSSEMIYPLLPLFLVQGLGASTAFVGTVEGVAESTAALFKLVAGGIADRARRRKPLTVLGYGVSTLVRPLVAVALRPWHVLLVRFGDRIGKGVRTSPRDAIVADVTPADARGRAFGLHRAMDNAGAVVGPLIAALLLRRFGLGLRTVFALAAVPGVLGLVVLVTSVVEPERAELPVAAGAGGVFVRLRQAAGALRLTPALSRYYAAVALFTLANSSDAFLLLLAQRHGIGEATLPILWTVLSAVRALAATPGGALSDRLGRRATLLSGWLLYALVYAGFAFTSAEWQVWALFVVYGLYYGLTEGTERALVADLAPVEARGRAYGGFHFVVGLLAFPASLGFGEIWEHVSPEAAFLAAAALALGAAVVLARAIPGPRKD